SDPEAIINQPPEVFGELAVDVAADSRPRLVKANRQRRLIGILRARWTRREHRRKAKSGHKEADQTQKLQAELRAFCASLRLHSSIQHKGSTHHGYHRFRRDSYSKRAGRNTDRTELRLVLGGRRAIWRHGRRNVT